MKPGERQKMCANCNGKVSFEATECPYCAAELAPLAQATAPSPTLFKAQTLQDSLASLYNPPYHSKMNEKENPAPKKQAVFTEPEPLIQKETLDMRNEENRQDFWALFALIVGGNLITIGLLQFFFSDKGMLTLEWDSRFWYLYCLIALPLFYFGFKKASNPIPVEK
jgi:hypothetical protein